MNAPRAWPGPSRPGRVARGLPFCSWSRAPRPPRSDRDPARAKTAERAPTTTCCAAAAAGARRRALPSDNPLWSTATLSPTILRTRLTICGVRPISGTSTIAPRPASTALDRPQVTSVLRPLVTPKSNPRRCPGSAPDPLERRGLLRGARGGRCLAAGEGIPDVPLLPPGRADSTRARVTFALKLSPSRCLSAAEPPDHPASRRAAAAGALVKRLSRSTRVSGSSASCSRRSTAGFPRFPEDQHELHGTNPDEPVGNLLRGR
jgi:hypothetical protein